MTPLPAARVLDQFFLDARSRVLDLAAVFDRLDRGGGADPADGRAARLREAVRLLLSDEPGRAARVQELFSLPYDPSWERPTPRF